MGGSALGRSKVQLLVARCTRREPEQEGVDALVGRQGSQARVISRSAGRYLPPPTLYRAMEKVGHMTQDETVIGEWRGDVCVALRDRGADSLADEFGGYDDNTVRSLYERSMDSPEAAAEMVATGKWWPDWMA